MNTQPIDIRSGCVVVEVKQLTSTPYSLIDREFTDSAHKKALAVLYIPFFKRPGIENFTVEVATFDQDTRQGIDYVVTFTSTHLPEPEPVSFTVQERFRRPTYSAYQDITVSEWLENSDTPSEVYTCMADLYLYGKYNATTDTIIEAVAVWMKPLRLALARGDLKYGRNKQPKQNKRFLTIPINTLRSRGHLAFQYPRQVADPLKRSA